jgi:hypothetical protein
MTNKTCDPHETVVSRRNFLKLGSATLVTITLPAYLRKVGMPTIFQANLVQYERRVIAKLSQLKPNEPLSFNYPWMTQHLLTI